MKSSVSQCLGLVAASLTVFASGLSFAQGGGGSTGGPSQDEIAGVTKTPATAAAVQACAGKSDGTKVRFTDEKGKQRHWICATVDGVRAARPGIATPARPASR